MSLTRQLWLAVIASTVLAFTGSFIVSMLTARNYLENQLAIKNRDNANSLALSITHVPKDPINIELQVAAVYDSGQYELIKLVDPEGKTMIERQTPEEAIDAPDWFVKLFPIVSRPGLAQISDGWKQFASIELISQRGYVYQELWKGALQLLYWFLAGGVFVGFLGTLLVRSLSRPLKAVVHQAEAISHRRFETIPLPRVPELRSVSEAMNTMVGRLKAMFDEEARRLEEVRREANLDKLTGLGNRSYFMGRLGNELNSDDTKPDGALMLLRLSDLAEINRRVGREITDNMVRQTGEIVASIVARDPEGMAGRLTGADFALLLPNLGEHETVAEELLSRTSDAANTHGLKASRTGQLGITVYRKNESVGAVMSRLDAALAAAEAKGGNAWEAIFDEAVVQSTSMSDWKVLIENAVRKRELKLVRFAVNASDGQRMHYECPLRLRSPDHDDWIAAGGFMPMASRLKLTAKLDLGALELALAELNRDQDVELALNLSGESIPEAEFVNRLQALLQSNPEASKRLWLEAPEVGVFRNFEHFAAFCRRISPLGCNIGVEHFGHSFSQIGRLHNLGLDYLKVDGSFIRDIHEQSGNQSFLKGLCSIAHNIGLSVIAEGVQAQEEIAVLPGLGFDGMTGPGVRDES